MPNLNKVMLMGNLTRDPELRYLPSNTAVVDFGLAVNRKWRGQDGEQREETLFVECSAFARTAEVINQYMKKGRPIFVDGRLRLEQWQDKQSGANRSKLSVVVENFQFLESRGGGEGGDYQQSGSDSAASAPRQPAAAPTQTVAAQPEMQQPAAQPGAQPGAQPAAQTAAAQPHQPVEDGDIPF